MYHAGWGVVKRLLLESFGCAHLDAVVSVIYQNRASRSSIDGAYSVEKRLMRANK